MRNGIRFLSDTLSAKADQPMLKQGIIDVPINTLPDHDYVYHGARQPGDFDESPLLKSVFKTTAISKEKWLDLLKDQVLKIESENGLSVLLVHPACMEVMDDFQTFTKLCRFVSAFRTIKMSAIELQSSPILIKRQQIDKAETNYLYE